jgi:hypothetical protein
MRKLILPAIALLCFAAATSAGPSDRHVKVPLEESNGSGASGFVNLTQLPQGGVQINVVVRGLRPNTEYASFYYESTDCSFPADLLGEFTTDDEGNGHVNGRADEDLDEIGSVSVRSGVDYETLLACATIHDG